MLIIKDNKGEDGRRKEEDTINKGVKMVLSYIIGIIMVVNNKDCHSISPLKFILDEALIRAASEKSFRTYALVLA